MNKILLTFALIVLSLTGFQHAVAHGSGSSYDFDKQDRTVDREAEKKATEKKQDQDTWDSFMNDINTQKKESTADENHNHADTYTR